MIWELQGFFGFCFFAFCFFLGCESCDVEQKSQDLSVGCLGLHWLLQLAARSSPLGQGHRSWVAVTIACWRVELELPFSLCAGSFGSEGSSACPRSTSFAA